MSYEICNSPSPSFRLSDRGSVVYPTSMILIQANRAAAGVIAIDDVFYDFFSGSHVHYCLRLGSRD